jgi:hypothetical protein
VLLRHELLPAFGDVELAPIDPAAVRMWFAGAHGKRGPTTVAKAYRLLSAILRSAFEDGRIARNPCSLKGAGREPRTEPGPSGLVFPAPDGGPMRRSNFTRRVWIPARTELGFEGVRFHDLRHTAAAVAIASGAANPLVLSRRLGHSTTRMTFDRYGHLFEGADRALAEALDGLGRTARCEPVPKPIPISKGHAGGTKHGRRRAV